MREEWRPAVGLPGYEVSDQGRVRSVPRRVPGPHAGVTWPVRGGILAQTPRGRYLAVTVHGSPRSVHRLVAEAFHGPAGPALVACHNDGNSHNNAASNLRWDTASSNVLDQVLHGTHANAGKTKCKRGHPLSGANLYVSPKGSRECRTCRRAALERVYERRAAVVCPKPKKEEK